MQLKNGITVVHQKLEGYNSVALGVWVKTGAAYENVNNCGISHFIEHMLFKGTKARSAKDIALEVDGVGGEINAFTAKECTCFYTKTLSFDLEIGLSVLSDMIYNATFLEEHIETEKTVVIDEINMYEDSAEELVADILNDITFKGHPLSYPILGNKETVERFNREIIFAYYNRYYVPSNIVISIAGNYDEAKIFDLVDDYFGKHEFGTNESKFEPVVPDFNWNYGFKKKDFEQIQVSIDFPGIKFDHELSYEMMLMSNILGGTNSSRLFQSIREEKGLSYSVYSEPSFFDALGTLNVSFGVSKENLKETIEVLVEEINLFRKIKLTNQEIEHAKAHLRGSFFLNLEGSDNYMDLIGRMELFAHKEKSFDEMLNKINAISLEGVEKLIGLCFDEKLFSMAVVGDIDENEVKKLYQYMKNNL